MGKRGPQPTPTSLLKLRGSWRAKTRSDEPVMPEGKPPMPNWLSPLAKAEWKRVATMLYEAGVLTMADQTALAAYCQAYADYREAVKCCDTLCIQGHRGTVRNPAVAIKNEAYKQMLKGMAQFGLSPADRAGLSASPPKTKAQLEDDLFFNNRRGT